MAGIKQVGSICCPSSPDFLAIYSVNNVVACRKWTCALRAPTASSARIKGIRTENAVLINSENGVGFYTRSPIAHGWLFIRAQSVIRADGPPSAQYRAYTVASMQPVLLRAARANRVFRTDKRHPYGKRGFD